jgi:hypothetical protein
MGYKFSTVRLIQANILTEGCASVQTTAHSPLSHKREKHKEQVNNFESSLSVSARLNYTSMLMHKKHGFIAECWHVGPIQMRSVDFSVCCVQASTDISSYLGTSSES